MKKLRYVFPVLIVLGTIVVVSGFANSNSITQSKVVDEVQCKQKSMANLFVTHGHCSTPFSGEITNAEVAVSGNKEDIDPMTTLSVSFDIDPSSFSVCKKNDELTEDLRTPGLFIGPKEEQISFQSTNVYTMGLDWYQVNGILSIKGVKHEMKLFATGIRNPQDRTPSSLILHGQMDLQDWGIDYDQIVHGESTDHPNKWMYLNMKLDVKPGC